MRQLNGSKRVSQSSFEHGQGNPDRANAQIEPTILSLFRPLPSPPQGHPRDCVPVPKVIFDFRLVPHPNGIERKLLFKAAWQGRVREEGEDLHRLVGYFSFLAGQRRSAVNQESGLDC